MHLTEFWMPAFIIGGAAQCIFLSVCFAWPQSTRQRGRYLLALFMLMMGIRMLKSIVYIFNGHGISPLVMNLGFAAHLAAAVALYLYFLNYHKGYLVALSRSWPHLVLPVLILLTAPWLTLEGFWYRGGYHGLLIISLAYWLWSLKLLLDIRRERLSCFRKQWAWWGSILTGAGVFFLAYFANYVVGVLSYEQAPFLYAFAVFGIGYSAWRSRLPTPEGEEESSVKKYRNLSLSEEEVKLGRAAILQVIQIDRAFLEADFSLQQLSERTRMPAHVLSHVLNEYMHTRFTSLLNAYRIEEACRLLRLAEKAHYSIAAIAFEAGFGSLSVFNRRFREVKGITPSAYRRRYQ